MAIPQEILDKLRRNDPDVVGLNLTCEIESDKDVEFLVDALSNNTYLRSLTIQGFYKSKSISDKSTKLLSTCSYIEFLDLSFNSNITNEGAAAFVAHPCLETLYFRGCSVTPAGLIPFLKNNSIQDLRIAISASPEQQEGEKIQLKLKENASLTLEQKLSVLTADQLNLKLCQFMRRYSFCIEKLPLPLQNDAKKNPREWEDAITTGLVLSRNIAKLKGEYMEGIIASAEVFAQRYMELREEQQELMQFSKKAKVDREMSPSLSPPCSQPVEHSPYLSLSASL